MNGAMNTDLITIVGFEEKQLSKRKINNFLVLNND